MEGKIKTSLESVLQSMEQLNLVFEARLLALKQDGADEQDLRSLEQGVLAMKDAGRLYLTWADHFIERMNEAEVYDDLME